MNQEEANQKILELMNKYYELSKKEIQLFKELIFQCDLKIQGTYSFTPIVYALLYNKRHNFNLNEEQWNYLIKNSDLKIQDKYGFTPLMYALKSNKTENLNLNQEQIDYLIRNSDLTQKNNKGWIPLIYALKYNKTQHLNLSEEKIDYILKNSDLKQKNNHGITILMYALKYNKKQDLQLSIKKFKIMYAALNEKQKQKTFQKLIQKHVENDHQYLEEINLFLYDLQFKPNEKNIYWLKENQHQDILERIEKRDVFFKLNKEVNLMDNHQKIAIIKL